MLTNTHRLQLVREIIRFNYEAGGYCDGFRLIWAFERAAKGER